MGVHINEAWRHNLAGDINFAAGMPIGKIANGDDTVIGNGDIGPLAAAATAINYLAASE